jgi:hypothetical protein
MQAGRRERSRGATTRQIGTSDSRFLSLFDVSRKTSRAATHVDAYDEVLSDAGSTPAASTTFNLLMCNDLLLLLPFQIGTQEVQLCHPMAINC